MQEQQQQLEGDDGGDEEDDDDEEENEALEELQEMDVKEELTAAGPTTYAASPPQLSSLLDSASMASVASIAASLVDDQAADLDQICSPATPLDLSPEAGPPMSNKSSSSSEAEMIANSPRSIGSPVDVSYFLATNNDDLIRNHMAPAFTEEERQLVQNIMDTELESQRHVPVTMDLISSVVAAATTGRPVPYDICIKGYTTAMKRIIRFASNLDFFKCFGTDDQRHLLLANTDMIINVKTARVLRPGINLQDQLVNVTGWEGTDKNGYDHVAGSGTGSFALGGFARGDRDMVAPERRVEYKQIYTSPWASHACHEEKYARLMEGLFDLRMDKVSMICY
jgi:hypothetical protein